MTNRPNKIARVIHVEDPAAIVMIGSTEHKMEWQGTPPRVGDIFLVAPDAPYKIIEKIGQSVEGGWNIASDAMRWRKANAKGETRLDILWKRHTIRRAVRDYLDGERFIQIDCPLLVHGTTPDATIQSFAVGDRYLITSTDYQIKRLEAGGIDRIYTLTQNYRRDDGEGPFRNQEFTMLEWERIGQSLQDIEKDAEHMVQKAHAALGGTGRIVYNGHDIDLNGPWDRLSVRDAIQQHTKASLPDFSLGSLQKTVVAAGLELRDAYKNDIYFLFSILMDYIQPSLGAPRPVFLYDWPAFETSAAPETGRDGVAERSELYIAGIEISDGFPHLTDYSRQKEGFEHQQQRRRSAGIQAVAIDQYYLDAVKAGLPKGAGMALGFDRLVMVLTGQTDIKSVLAFAWDEV